MISHFLAFTLLIAIILSSCQHPATTKLKPGDKIGDMILTTGAAKAVPLWFFCSRASETNSVTTVECKVPLVSRLAIGNTFGVPDIALADLDWAASAWELFIDNQPLDLGTFGTYYVVFPSMTSSPSRIREVFKMIKVWDVVLENPGPESHTLRGLIHTKTMTYQWIVNIHFKEAQGD
jgi:hypothetical protein